MNPTELLTGQPFPELNLMEQCLKKEFENIDKALFLNPHEFSEIQQYISGINIKYNQVLPDLLFESDFLKESPYFSSELDTAYFQHIRYLPAIWHSHDFLEVTLVLNGTCTNHIIEQSIQMNTGDICIIAPNTTHAICACSDDCIVYNILLRISTFEKAFFGTLTENDILSDFFTRILYHSPSHPFLLFHCGKDSELFRYIGYFCLEYHSNRQYKNRMLNNIITAFFIILLRKHGAAVSTVSLGIHKQDHNIVYILKYMQANYRTLTMKELATFFNYSERHLHRLIKQTTGLSFSENITKLKMLQAAKLLSGPNMPVTAISENLGYSDTSNFRHAFKNYYKCSPQEYRKNRR